MRLVTESFSVKTTDLFMLAKLRSEAEEEKKRALHAKDCELGRHAVSY